MWKEHVPQEVSHRDLIGVTLSVELLSRDLTDALKDFVAMQKNLLTSIKFQSNAKAHHGYS